VVDQHLQGVTPLFKILVLFPEDCSQTQKHVGESAVSLYTYVQIFGFIVEIYISAQNE
jgi:hypothetical protein